MKAFIILAVVVSSFVTGICAKDTIIAKYEEQRIQWYTMKYTCQWKCGSEPSEEIARLINYDEIKKQNLLRAYASN